MTEEDQIKIFDDFLTYEELEKCKNATSRPKWSFGQISMSSPISTPFWMMVLDDDEFFNTHLFSKIQYKTGKLFKLERVYANGQTFGQDGTYHQDAVDDGYYTFCVYINKQITSETADSIGGEFVFKTPNRSNKVCSVCMIEPTYNKGLFFPSNIFHKGLAFNRYNKGLRISITWKLKVIENL
jgi:hypothetical protein